MLQPQMFSQTFHEVTRPMKRVQRAIWIMFNGAILAYVAVICFLFGLPTGGAEPLRSNPLSVPLGVLAVLTAITSLWSADLVLPKSRIRAVLDRQLDPGDPAPIAQTSLADTEHLARIALSDDEQRMRALIPFIFNALIVQLAFGNAIALYGLLLGYFSQSVTPMLPFVILSLILNLRVSPNLDTWLERAAKRATQ